MDEELSKLLIQHRRKRQAKGRTARSKRKRKRVYRAYWLRPSFSRVIVHNIRRDEVFFVGSHKPGVIKGKDYPPTPVFGVIGSDFREALPMEHDDFPKLVAALIKASNDPDIGKKTRMNVEIHSKSEEMFYREFDFNTVPYETVLQDCQYIYEVPRINPKNIAWMQNVFSYNIREVKSKDMRVRQLLLVGRDVQNYTPIIALVKPRYNFYHIIPLPDKGINLITSLKLLIYCRPHIQFAISSVDSFEDAIRSTLDSLPQRFAYFDIATPLRKIIQTLRG